MELFGSSASGWKRPALALSIRSPGDTSAIRLHLLEVGLVAARERGASDVFMTFHTIDTWMYAIVRLFGGTLDHKAGTAVIPCKFVATDGLGCWHDVV